MDGSSIGGGWILLIFLGAWALNLGYLAFLHKLRGRPKKLVRTVSAMQFKTAHGTVRLDGVHKRIGFRPGGKGPWISHPFEDLQELHCRQSEGSGALLEFLFSDFAIWDFAGQYRDVVNHFELCIRVPGAEEITLITLKQFEQRELWLGQFFHDLELAILGRLGLYEPIREAGFGLANELIENFARYGLKLRLA
ncbi:MAG: hypothetical protein AAGE01_16935 [Pseudomonadota bacterium]